MEYSMDKASVDALLEWARSYSFPKELRLSDSEFIFDVPRFVQSNVSEINIHYPDSFFEPCIVRLYRLKKVIENKE